MGRGNEALRDRDNHSKKQEDRQRAFLNTMERNRKSVNKIKQKKILRTNKYTLNNVGVQTSRSIFKTHLTGLGMRLS